MLKRILPAKSHLRFLIPAFILAFTVLAAGCGLIGGDDEDEPDTSRETANTPAAGEVGVSQAVMSRTVNEDFQATGIVSRVFPTDTQRVYAVLVLRGAKVGDVVNGRWYQLSVDNAPPSGSFVTEAGVTLTEENLSEDGLARVALDLGTNNGQGLPPGDWVVRVDVNNEFVRTLGFVISQFVVYPDEGSQQQPAGATGATGTTGSAEPTATPAESLPPAPTPTETPAPQPETYTVVSGDTLTIIAERFKTANETTEAYVARLNELNNLQPGSILFVGQVLTLPGAP